MTSVFIPWSFISQMNPANAVALLLLVVLSGSFIFLHLSHLCGHCGPVHHTIGLVLTLAFQRALSLSLLLAVAPLLFVNLSFGAILEHLCVVG